MKHRVVVWGTGFVGKMVLRDLIPHPDFELVGLIVNSPEKVGKDAGEIAGVVQRVDAPGLLDDGVDLVARQREDGLVDEFLRELLVAERPVNVAERLLDEFRQRLTVAQHDFDMHLVLGDAVVADRRRHGAHALERGVRERFLGELLDAAFAAD